MTSPAGDAPAAAADVVRSYLASFASGDADGIASHVTEEFVNEHASALGEGCTGRDEYRRRLPAFLDTMRGVRYEVEDLVADGGRVAVAYHMAATMDGHAVDVRGAMWFDVEADVREGAGLIARRTDYWDSAPFLIGAGRPSER